MKKEIIYPATRCIVTGLFACLLVVMVTAFRGDPSWALGGQVGAIPVIVTNADASRNSGDLAGSAGVQ